MTHLEEELRPHADVWAIAPDRERSATGQAISIRETLRLIRVRDRHYMLTGFPVDCVNVALYSGKFPTFDLVISGINHGVNLGDDVHYSGTVGAARHAAVHNIRAVAVSCPIRDHQGDFRRAARWLRMWIFENFEKLKPGIVYNINYPFEENPGPDTPLPRVRAAAQGRRLYFDMYEELEESPDESLLRLKDTQMGSIQKAESDFEMIEAGFAVITPLSIDTTHYPELTEWTGTKEKKSSLSGY